MEGSVCQKVKFISLQMKYSFFVLATLLNHGIGFVGDAFIASVQTMDPEPGLHTINGLVDDEPSFENVLMLSENMKRLKDLMEKTLRTTANLDYIF